MRFSFSPTVTSLGTMSSSSSQSKAFLWICLLISSGLISLSLSEVNSPARETVQNIEFLYNQVLQSSINNCRETIEKLNDTSVIDKQYFIDLDKQVGNQDYYSTAYFIFAVIHGSLITNQAPDQLRIAVLPAEKAFIRTFFSKVRLDLLKYFKSTNQAHLELMRNVTHWQNESKDSLVVSYLEFPQTLKQEVPELELMDYEKQAKIIVEGIMRKLELAS